jgi:hypothetical protein
MYKRSILNPYCLLGTGPASTIAQEAASSHIVENPVIFKMITKTE